MAAAWAGDMRAARVGHFGAMAQGLPTPTKHGCQYRAGRARTGVGSRADGGDRMQRHASLLVAGVHECLRAEQTTG